MDRNQLGHRGGAGRRVGRGRRGVTSILAMLYLMLFSAMAIGFYAQTVISSQVSAGERATHEARLAAESGMAFARYHLSALAVPRLAPAQQLEEIYMQLAERLDGTANLGPGGLGVVGYDGHRVEIPEGSNNFVRTAAGGPGFRVVIKIKPDRTLQVKTVGRSGATTTSPGRGVEITFKPQEIPAPIFKYGVASRGVIEVTGGGQVTAVNPADGNVLSMAGTNPALTMTGPSVISGSVSFTNPAATASLGVNSKVANSTDPAVRNANIRKGVEAPEFPVIDTSMYLPFVKTTWLSPTGTNAYLKNARIPAGLNPSFTNTTTVDGVLYVEAPNVITFSGACIVRGVIVVANNPAGTAATNSITFSGRCTARGPETLPATMDFPPELRALTGAAFICPKFALSFSGGYDGIGGTIAADKITVTGTAGGTIDGSILNLSGEKLTVSGSGVVNLKRSAETKWPAGMFFRCAYGPEQATYLETAPD